MESFFSRLKFWQVQNTVGPLYLELTNGQRIKYYNYSLGKKSFSPCGLFLHTKGWHCSTGILNIKSRKQSQSLLIGWQQSANNGKSELYVMSSSTFTPLGQMVRVTEIKIWTKLQDRWWQRSWKVIQCNHWLVQRGSKVWFFLRMPQNGNHTVYSRSEWTLKGKLSLWLSRKWWWYLCKW